MSLLYRGGRLLTQDPALGELTGDLLVVGDRIAGLGPRIEVPEDTEVVDARGLVIVPGFVDTHRHLW